MRDLLTYLGIALIVVLTAAFVAPFVVDFGALRPRIAEELAQATAAKIRLDGPIAVKFLPTPRFSADNLDVSGDFGHVHAEKALFELSLPGLLQGRLHFSRVTLDGAEIALDADKAAEAPIPAALQVDSFALRGAHLAIHRGDAASAEISGLDLKASIPSLLGPMTGRGGFDWRGQRVGYSFATDEAAKGVLPLKASLTWPDEAAAIDLDGRLDLGKTPAFEGAAKASGKAPPGPWTAEGPILVSLDGFLARDMNARLGDGPLADKISFSARYDANGGKRTFAAQTPSLSAPWAEFATSLLAADGAGPLDLRFGAQALNWRGMDWSDVELVWPPGGRAQFKGTGPGATRVELSVALDKQDWRGKAQIRTADWPRFAAALAEAVPATRPLAGLAVQSADMAGDVSVSPQEWALSNAALTLGKARLAGDLRYRLAAPGTRPALAAKLSSPALDLDAFPDFAGAGLEGLDLDLAIEAQTLRSARGGELSGAGGRIGAHLLRSSEAIQLEKLDMRNIGGADLTASASWGKDGAGLRGEARLKAADLTPLAQVLARLWPGEAAKAIAARAKGLSPADLSGKAADGGLSVSGTLGATKIAVSLPPSVAGRRAVAVDVTAPEAGALLNQLGAQTVWLQRLGAARLQFHSTPDPAGEGAEKVSGSADIAGLRGDFQGAMTNADPLAIEGEAAVAGDGGKILAAFSGAQASAFPLRLGAHLLWRDGALAAQKLAGEAAGTKLTGDLTVDSAGIAGGLHLESLSAPALAALLLGPPPPAKAGALWSSLSFAPVNFDLPRAKLAMEVDALEPLGGKGTFDLALAPGVLSVSRAALEIFGGTLRGGLDLRRDGGQVNLSGEAEAAGMAMKTPALSGRLDGRLRFAGDGANAAALAGSLAGEGAAHIADLAIEGAAPGATQQAFAITESGEGPFDARQAARSLDAAFAKGPRRESAADFSVRLAGGQAAFAPANEAARGIEASLDVRDGSLTVSVAEALRELPPGWASWPGGQPPRAAAIWSGPWRKPVRRVEADAFVNAVATRALEREQARIEQQKREDQERLRALQAQPVLPDLPPAPDIATPR
jgi:hypothetical protein